MNQPQTISPLLDKAAVISDMIDAIARLDGWQHGDEARELAPELFDRYYKLAEAAFGAVQHRLQPKAGN